MKRDMDLIRDLLLFVEDLKGPPGTNYHLDGHDERMSIAGWDGDGINHHLIMLRDAGLIERTRVQPADGSVITTGLTWEGRDFLDTVRDPEIWRRTKEGAGTIGGWTFEMLKALGKAYLKQAAKDRLGIEL